MIAGKNGGKKIKIKKKHKLLKFLPSVLTSAFTHNAAQDRESNALMYKLKPHMPAARIPHMRSPAQHKSRINKC
jgi:hypothetical protein